MCDAVSAITVGLKVATAVQDYRSKPKKPPRGVVLKAQRDGE